MVGGTGAATRRAIEPPADLGYRLYGEIAVGWWVWCDNI